MTSEDPPKETSGSVTPVTGSSPTTEEMLMLACRTSQAVMEAASRRPKMSAAPMAIRTPRNARPARAASRVRAPSSPSSSPTMAKMKSVWALGMYSHLPRPCPSPTPNHPPEPRAMKPWVVW